jgi:hypothetical protein
LFILLIKIFASNAFAAAKIALSGVLGDKSFKPFILI